MEHFDRERIVGLASVVNEFATDCLDAAISTRHMSEYEHVQETRTAFLLLRGHAKALLALADLGAESYPSGWPIARSMFEVGVRTAWRMDVDDPYVAEGRWATWLARFVVHERARSTSLDSEGAHEWAREARSRASQADAFHSQFIDLLGCKGVHPAERELSMKRILKSLGQPDHRYQIYADASEQLHGSFVAMEAYSRDLGVKRRIGEFAHWRDWVPPLRTGFVGVQALSHVFEDRIESGRMSPVIAAAENAWEATLRRGA